MIAAVSMAEERLAASRKTVFAAARLPAAIAGAAEIAPILRGACAIPSATEAGAYKRFILDFRTGPAVLNYVNGVELGALRQAGVATPDHTIRTKNYPLIVPPPEAGGLDRFEQAVGAAVARFAADYHAYFARHNARQATPKRELDPVPRVILVPGLGLFGLGAQRQGRARSPPTSRCRRSRPSPTPRRSAGSNRSARPICSTWNTGRSNRRSSARRPKRRSPARSRW